LTKEERQEGRKAGQQSAVRKGQQWAATERNVGSRWAVRRAAGGQRVRGRWDRRKGKVLNF